ncbi:LptA/OstA family protein [Sphingomicrobium astaxanthinifaciens]|uniref:LptA/OstA family protein n=1 Tax=Sphingomicrobium astaxanthinifaciens TaxID=1227949 RepID=UPI001FCCADDD|nr:LptA/OstA family protein [Sphingomicrobium astaxanthinifaciens]MCJ7421113.1 LptA/OstA family protein [Sphingomicrobium astaxanthinifaciens]
MNIMHVRSLLAALLLAGLAAGASARQDASSALRGHDIAAPVEVAADRIEVQDRDDRALFVGNVVVRQAGLTLVTERLRIAYAADGGIDIKRLDASGGVTLTSGTETARGGYAVYDLDGGIITLVGDVELRQGRNELFGSRLTIDLDSGRAVIDGGPRGVDQSGGRVTGRFTVPRRD